MHNRTGHDSSSPEDDGKQELKSFFAAAKHAADQQNAFGSEAPAAMARLAMAIYGHDNSQAVTGWNGAREYLQRFRGPPCSTR